MEDELACVNVSSKNMPSYVSYDGESVSNLSEVSGEVENQSTDFGQDASEAKLPNTDDGLDFPKHRHERRGSKESNEKETVRKTLAVDILRRNFGPSKSSVLNDSNVERPKDREKVERILQNLEQGRFAENGRTRCDPNRGSNSKLPDFFPSLDLEDLELSDTEGNVESNKGGDESLSEEHVYCTVYCIANDESKKPSENTGTLDNMSPSDGSASPPNESLNPDMGRYPEGYTLADLVDSTMLNNVHNADYNLSVQLTCRICFDEKHIKPLHCCKKAVCEECLKKYITSQVLVGQVDIACPITECSGYLEENVIVSHLAAEELAKYKYFQEVSRLDSGTKPCPQCSMFTSLKGRGLQATGKAEHKYKIQCTKCLFVWCFKCHAPWHDGLKCREYRKGDKLLRHWASVIEHGQRNAQKCPRCKIHIQRTEGCDHMTCTQCNTNFCYRCGEKYRHLRFFGDHTSNLSVFGCKYRYLPDRPHLRRAVRGSVCVSKVLVAPVVIVMLVVLGALALIIGLLAFPVYYIYKKHRKHSNGTGRWLC
ncbi:probable E3 ubiquitin-protein ligase RNF217 isoform X1 [Electrophorus electricus]|uniref:probable E3 ubiquitin-protein ligase RNF217 isoform X1 n=1 Tax=Electrophorus electricus TaxID=8005 RepID=UPI0015CFB8D6|nr:probable E3 ubiquitin-protein ligase RNF217 isoform X1 [Electrophorus electricus]